MSNGSKQPPARKRRTINPNIDHGYAWVVLFAVFVNHVIVDGLMFSYAYFKLEFMEYFGKSDAETTLIGSILNATCLLTGAVAGMLINRFGCRTVAMAGSVIATIGFCSSVFCTSTTALMITYGAIAGLGLGFLYLPSVVAVTFYFKKRRALATGIAVW
jgi:MFS family permease